jgi:hypothetical protein
VNGFCLRRLHPGEQVHEDLLSRWKFQMTALASRGVPSLNLMPGRSLIVSVLASGLSVPLAMRAYRRRA